MKANRKWPHAHAWLTTLIIMDLDTARTGVTACVISAWTFSRKPMSVIPPACEVSAHKQGKFPAIFRQERSAFFVVSHFVVNASNNEELLQHLLPHNCPSTLQSSHRLIHYTLSAYSLSCPLNLPTDQLTKTRLIYSFTKRLAWLLYHLPTFQLIDPFF